LGITESLISNEELSGYDWSRVVARMVYSVPGMASVSHASGLVMLAGRVPVAEKLDWIESQGSSLGAMTETWLDDVMTCCTGRLPGNSRKRPADDAPMDIKVIFPTTEYALNSELGPGAFGTIFCQSKNWNSPTYPHSLFYKCISISKDCRPLHTKILNTPKWIYLGSSNFTQSAWGKFVKEKSALMIANYELGVIIEAANFPFPYRRPVMPYDKDDVPWMQELLQY
jgi:tyrosyl-DNA phosphodiesterase-1